MAEKFQHSVGFSRRDLLKRGAVVGAAAVWTVPLVQAISMSPAHAESPSSPTGGGGGTPISYSSSPSPITVTTPETTTAPATTSGAVSPLSEVATTTGGAKPTSETKGALAFTGTEFPVPATVGVAAAALVVGAGAIAAGAVYSKKREGQHES